MARRVDELLSPIGLRSPLIATFHSACVRILRSHGSHLGLPSHFTIYDEDDRLALVKECMKDGELADRTFTPSAAVHRISYLKNQMIAVTEALRDARGPWEKKAALVYSRYDKRLRETGAVDFDDLLLLVVRLLAEIPEVLAWYRGLWRYVLVDEYQDTNRAQYRIIQLLTSEHRNVCVVGDSDQSIYKWRGADVRNILDFEEDFPGTKVVRLEQNYRSTQSILALAAGVIAHNVQRKDKTLWTENAAGPPARLYRAWDEQEEAGFVAQSILGLRGEGVPWDDVAVFYRTNAQSRVLEDALRRGRIPYVIVGGVRFYERREIKDALAYLRLTINPADDVAFRRAIGAPARGIGATTLARLDEEAAASDAAAAGAGRRAAHGHPRQGGPHAAGVRRARSGAWPGSAATWRRRRSSISCWSSPGYRDALKQERAPETEARLENLEELIAAAEDYTHSEAEPTLEGFLDGVALMSDVDELKEAEARVTLMTLHSAKGLEFPAVFITGLEEGVFPHSRSMNDPDEIEEERRLCYVGHHAGQGAALAVVGASPSDPRLRSGRALALSPRDARESAAPAQRRSRAGAEHAGARGGALRAGGRVVADPGGRPRAPRPLRRGAGGGRRAGRVRHHRDGRDSPAWDASACRCSTRNWRSCSDQPPGRRARRAPGAAGPDRRRARADA